MATICIDCRYVRPRPSGIGEMVAQLARRAPLLAPDLDFLLLVAPDVPERLCTAANVREEVVSAPANGPASMWYLAQVVDLTGVDLFHATFNFMPARLPMPCLVTIHDLMWRMAPHLCETGLRGRVRAAFFGHGIGRALRDAAAIATVSEATQQAIAGHYPPAAGRVVVTRSGVSSVFQPVTRDPAALRAIGLDPDRRLVLCVGQSAPYKNHDGALAAFALVALDRPDLDLVLVQRQGRAAGRLLASAAALGLAGRVHILRDLAAADLRQLYGAAAVLLHPSFCEGFGHPLAEAMASGCPVVTSDCSAMPEVTAGAALLADPNDHGAIAAALARVLDQPGLAEKMRAKGQQRAAELNWDDFATANVALYRDILAL